MPDPCQPIQQGIAHAQDTKRALQEDLKGATPSQKAGIIKLIKQLDAEIAEQKERLRECRETNPAPLRPDIGWELGICLDPTTRGDVERQLTATFEPVGGIAHGTCLEATERLGVWAPSVGSEEGRRNGLEFVNLAGSGATAFGMSVARDFINRRTRAANEVLPRVLDAEGNPNQSGPIFLSSGLSTRMEPPSTIVSSVEGFRRLPLLPDVDFTVTIADTYRIARTGDPEPIGSVAVDTSVDIETNLPGFEVLLNAIFPNVLTTFNTAFLAGVDLADGLIERSGLQGQGIGRALLSVFPTQLSLTSGTRRLLYDRIEVFPGFILAGGHIQ